MNIVGDGVKIKNACSLIEDEKSPKIRISEILTFSFQDILCIYVQVDLNQPYFFLLDSAQSLQWFKQ